MELESGSGTQQPVERAEISVGGIAFHAAHLVERQGILEAQHLLLEAQDESFDVRIAGGCGMVAQMALEDGAGIVELAEDEHAGEIGRFGQIVRPTVLHAAQQHVAGLWAIHAGKEFAVFGEKTDRHAVFAAMAEQKGAAQDVAETDQAADVVNGEAGAHLLFGLDDDGFAFLAQISALGGDVQGVEHLFHWTASER